MLSIPCSSPSPHLTWDLVPWCLPQPQTHREATSTPWLAVLPVHGHSPEDLPLQWSRDQREIYIKQYNLKERIQLYASQSSRIEPLPWTEVARQSLMQSWGLLFSDCLSFRGLGCTYIEYGRSDCRAKGVTSKCVQMESPVHHLSHLCKLATWACNIQILQPKSLSCVLHVRLTIF